MMESAYNRLNSPWMITHQANISEHEYISEETCGTDDRYACYALLETYAGDTSVAYWSTP